MATAVVPGTSQFKRMQAHRYVALSPNCRSSQLLTPRDLTRITIDDRHYDQYQKCLRSNTPGHIYSVPGGEIPTYGDRVAFYCQRDLPVTQFYTNTLLQRSRVRQTDELMPKPLSSNGVVDKEINLPFPAEHPYSSHIKCFSMIPNTSPVAEATKVSSKDISYPIFVKEKASDSWSRLEDMHINSKTRPSTGPIWDLPRSHRHLRCYTYPAPKQIYVFGSRDSRQQTGKELSPYTVQGLNRINRLIYYETSYQNQFPGYWLQSSNGGVQNVLVVDDSTSDENTNKIETEQVQDNENVEESEEFAFDSQEEVNKGGQKNDESVENVVTFEKVHNDNAPEADQQNTDKSNSLDQDLQDMLHLAETAKIQPSKPHVSTDDRYRFYRVDLVPDSQLPGSSQKKLDLSSHAFTNVPTDRQPLKQSPFTPRTAIASRRLMSAFDFNRSAVQRQFHVEYPEKAPDLRENSSQGRRHVIHGHHAYYFH